MGQEVAFLAPPVACRYLGVWGTPTGDMSATKTRIFKKTEEARDLLRHHPVPPEQAIDLFTSIGVGSFRYSSALVPWTEKELERLESVWIQAYKWAWGLPRTTASDVFVLPAGMEYLRPVVMAQELCRHLQQCLKHEDVSRQLTLRDLHLACEQWAVCRCCWRSSFVLNYYLTPETLHMPQRNCSTPHKFCDKCGAWLWWKRWITAASAAASDYIVARNNFWSSAATHGQTRQELEHDLTFKTFTLIRAIVRPREHPLRSSTRTLYSTPTSAMPHGINNSAAVGGNICFISAILQLLVRIPEFIVLLSSATTTLGKGLYQILHALSASNLNEYDSVLISWIECAGQHGLRSIIPGTIRGDSGDPSEFLFKLLDRLGTLEGPEFQEQVQLLFEQRSIRRLTCPECKNTSYHEQRTRML